MNLQEDFFLSVLSINMLFSLDRVRVASLVREECRDLLAQL